jgi:hypothetical protein
MNFQGDPVAALTSLVLLEESLGRELTLEETPVAEYYIRLISAYIINYTGLEFDDPDESPPGETSIRVKSDYYGIVSLGGGSVTDVSSVKMWGSQGEHPSWRWDGLNEVFGLRPNETVDITYIVGHSTVPSDLELVATEGVRRLFDSPTGDIDGPRTKYRVGDVEESYRAVDISLLGGLFNDFEKMILDSYRTTMTTWHLGFAQQPEMFALPQPGDNEIIE